MPAWTVFFSFFLLSLITIPTNGLSVNIINVIIDASKYLLWILFAAVVVPLLYDNEILLYWLKRIAFILTTYLIIQTVAYYAFGIFLPNIFSFGPLVPYDSGYADYSGIDRIAFLRPASFLSEPSFYGNYAIFTLCLVLNSFKNTCSKIDLLLSLYLTLGIILSSSTSAIIMLALVWGILGWDIIRVYKKISILCLFGLVLVILSIVSNFDSLGDSGSQTDTAVFQTFDKFSRADDNRRLGTSFDYLDRLDSSELLFGVGIGCDKAKFHKEFASGHLYMNSVTTLVVQLGYVGAGIFALFILSVLMKAIRYRNKLVITLLAIYVIKAFASGILFNTYGIMLITIVTGSMFTSINEKHYEK